MPRRDRFLTGVAGAVVSVALLAAFAGLIVLSEMESELRERLAQVIEPLDRTIDGIDERVLRVSTGTRGYLLLGPASEFGAQAEESSAQLVAELATLQTYGRAAGFGAQTDRVIALAEAYSRSASDARALSRAGDREAANAIIATRTEVDLKAYLAAAADLEAAITVERETSNAEFRSIARLHRIVLAGAVGLALISVLLLTLVSIRGQQLASTLRARDARIEAIIAGVPGVVWEAWGEPDASSQRIDFVSDYVETMLGYTKEEWLSTPNFWLRIVHPEDRERTGANARAAFNAGRFTPSVPAINDFRWVAKDGRVLAVRAFASVIRDETGQPVGMRGITFDISPQKRAEDALEAERIRMENMLRTMAYGVCEIDNEGTLVYVNPAGERLLGHAASSIRGRSLHDVAHVVPLTGEPVHPDEECVFARMRDFSAPFEARDTFVRRPETTFVADLVAAPVRVAGRTTGAVVAFQDVTERQRLEQLKDDYLSFASHELRTPLTVLSAMAQFLQRRAKADPTRFDDDTREAIESLAGEAERMVRMVEVFLDLARIESGRLVMEQDPVDLTAVLATEAELTRRSAPQVHLDVRAPEALPIWTDETRLRQVLRNLLDNAAKHAGPEPHVTLQLTADRDEVRIEVSDDGPGIPQSDLPHVFERLYRASNAHSTGLGAGLFIAREIVERLGGSISVRSEANVGTTFTVRLPRNADAAQRAVDTALER